MLYQVFHFGKAQFFFFNLKNNYKFHNLPFILLKTPFFFLEKLFSLKRSNLIFSKVNVNVNEYTSGNKNNELN